MAETTNVSKLIINYLTEAQYQTAKASGLINENELYVTDVQDSTTLDCFEELFTATAGQTLFTLTEGTYVPNQSRLTICVNGAQQPSTAYTETSSSSFTFDSGLSAGDSVIARYVNARIVSNINLEPHKTTHYSGGTDPLAPSDIGAAASTHKSTHAIGGSDPLTPADIGVKDTNVPISTDIATALSLTGNPQVKDALFALYLGAGRQGYDLTFTYSNGQPVKNMKVAGITTSLDDDAYTDASGHVFGVSTSNNPTISIDYTGYADVDNFSAQIAGAYPIKTQSITVPLKSSQTLTLTSSQTLKFSNAVGTFSATVVSGGGGGGGGHAGYTDGQYWENGGGGGGGGYVTTISNKTPTSDLSIVVGAGGNGGAAATSGTNGGNSSISAGTTTLASATGGSAGGSGGGSYNSPGGGGAGNGKGGGGGAGHSGSIYVAGTAPTGGAGGYGGGGGSGHNSSSTGGSPYGGDGGCTSNGSNATGYGGGGGGGGAKYPSSSYTGGAGGAGAVILSWTNKS